MLAYLGRLVSRQKLSQRHYDYLNLSNNNIARHIPKENKGTVARQRTLICRGFPGHICTQASSQILMLTDVGQPSLIERESRWRGRIVQASHPLCYKIFKQRRVNQSLSSIK